MKLHLFLIFMSFIFNSTASAQVPDINELQDASKNYMRTRMAQWPEIFEYLPRENPRDKPVKNPAYNPNSELIAFQSAKPSMQRALLKAAFDNDTEAFFTVWNKMSKRQKDFFTSDYDFQSNRTRLHHAAMSPREKWANESKTQDDPSILLELCKYSDVNAQDNSGDTALTLALWTAQGNFNMAKALIKTCGADITLASNMKSTPLLLSAYWGNWSMFKMLIDMGADDWALDFQEKGVYHYFNQGRVKKAYTPNLDSVKLKSWLDQNNHDFATEALAKCTGFNDRNAIISEKSLLSPKYKNGALSNSPVFEIDPNERESIRDKMNATLKEKCENFGYTSCNVIVSDLLNGPVQNVSEEVTLNVGTAKIYYGYHIFYAVVMGSASGESKDCPFPPQQ